MQLSNTNLLIALILYSETCCADDLVLENVFDCDNANAAMLCEEKRCHKQNRQMKFVVSKENKTVLIQSIYPEGRPINFYYENCKIANVSNWSCTTELSPETLVLFATNQFVTNEMVDSHYTFISSPPNISRDSLCAK